MAFVFKKFGMADVVDHYDLPVLTNAVLANGLGILASNTTGVNGTVAAGATAITANLFLSEHAAAAGARGLFVKLQAGMEIEVDYQTGTPAVGDEVEVFSNNLVIKKNTNPAIGKVVKLVPGSTSKAVVLVI